MLRIYSDVDRFPRWNPMWKPMQFWKSNGIFRKKSFFYSKWIYIRHLQLLSFQKIHTLLGIWWKNHRKAVLTQAEQVRSSTYTRCSRQHCHCTQSRTILALLRRVFKELNLTNSLIYNTNNQATVVKYFIAKESNENKTKRLCKKFSISGHRRKKKQSLLKTVRAQSTTSDRTG